MTREEAEEIVQSWPDWAEMSAEQREAYGPPMVSRPLDPDEYRQRLAEVVANWGGHVWWVGAA
jgi:hypothetical protein